VQRPSVIATVITPTQRRLVVALSGWILGLVAYGLGFALFVDGSMSKGDVPALLLSTGGASLIEFFWCWFVVESIRDLRPRALTPALCAAVCGLSGAIGLTIWGLLMGVQNPSEFLTAAAIKPAALLFVTAGVAFGLGLFGIRPRSLRANA
jgi:hypothetical protein